MVDDFSPKNELYERCFSFAKDVRILVSKLSRTTANFEDGKQVVRSSGSVGANYIEAWETISKKDEIHRLKICRKEAKESQHWLKLLFVSEEDKQINELRNKLAQEALELTKILGSIINRIQ